jgi:alpha-1,2-mannosyltransferase
MVGATRGKDDELIVEQLKLQAADMKIEDTVEFMLNKSFDEILKLFAQSKVAIHTMKEEQIGRAHV